MPTTNIVLQNIEIITCQARLAWNGLGEGETAKGGCVVGSTMLASVAGSTIIGQHRPTSTSIALAMFHASSSSGSVILIVSRSTPGCKWSNPMEGICEMRSTRCVCPTRTVRSPLLWWLFQCVRRRPRLRSALWFVV